MTHIINSFDISVYNKDIAKTLFSLNINVTSWTENKDDSNIPLINDFEIVYYDSNKLNYEDDIITLIKNKLFKNGLEQSKVNYYKYCKFID